MNVDDGDEMFGICCRTPTVVRLPRLRRGQRHPPPTSRSAPKRSITPCLFRRVKNTRADDGQEIPNRLTKTRREEKSKRTPFAKLPKEVLDGESNGRRHVHFVENQETLQAVVAELFQLCILIQGRLIIDQHVNQ